jgi:predicted Zn-dependent protease
MAESPDKGQQLIGLFRDLSGLTHRIRETTDLLGERLNNLSAEERQIYEHLTEMKVKLIDHQSKVMVSCDPIDEPEALKKCKDFALKVRLNFEWKVDAFCADIQDNPMQALQNELSFRELIRYNFYNDVMEKIGIYADDIKWCDIPFRVESTINWMLRQVSSNPQLVNPKNLLEVITWRWYREVVLELTHSYGLSDRKENLVMDFYDMVIELQMRVNKAKALR